MIIKRLASVAFALAFLMALVVFARVGTAYISVPTARILFMVFGAIALVLNLFSFQSSKHNPVFTLVYWLGSIILFTGLIFMYMHWPYSRMIVFGGLFITGISFFLSPTLIEGERKNSDILDGPRD